MIKKRVEIAVGGPDSTRRRLQRDARAFHWLRDAGRDLAYGARTLSRVPAFTTAAILTLALGISAVTVIYSVLRNVVLDPFPYSRSDRLVNVELHDASGRQVRGAYFPAPEFLDYQEQTTVFEDVVATSRDSMHWVSENGVERVEIAWMTPNGFDFLGVKPMLGRVFGASDVAPGAPPVAVMAHRAWVRLFAADPAVIGRTLVLDGTGRTVVGVMPPRFEWNVADLWIPALLTRSDDPRTALGFRAFQAHLRPGVTAREAEAQLQVVGERRARQHPDEYPPRFRFKVLKVVDAVVRDFRGVLYTLFGAVSLLLVIACCNVANMLLARATIREREIAIRAAIGASRGRIVRQLLVESALLAGGGLLAGCGLAYVGIAALARYMPRQGVPWETVIRLDWPVLSFAALAAAISTLAFGLVPALQSARRDVAAGANALGRTTAGRTQTRIRGSLVVAQVALSIVLLCGAGLLMRSFVKLVGVDWGFDSAHVLAGFLSLPPHQRTTAEEQRGLYRRVVDRAAVIPGVRAASGCTSGYPPIGGLRSAIQVPGLPTDAAAQVSVLFCSEAILESLGIPLLRGRTLTALDVEQGRLVAVVNEALARQYFGSGDPLGRIIRLQRLAAPPSAIADPAFEVIGVMRNVANLGPRAAPSPQVIVPMTLRLPGGMAVVMRLPDDPLRAVTALRREIGTVDARVALVAPTTLDQLIQTGFYARPRFILLMLGIFAGTGIVLVALGVYGVLAYTVSQQTREIALRLALGGEPGHVVRMILRLGLKLVGVGLVIGLAASLATNRLLVAQLWNTSPHDPVTLGAVAALVLVVGMLACWVPARRAVRVEPMVALRHD